MGNTTGLAWPSCTRQVLQATQGHGLFGGAGIVLHAAENGLRVTGEKVGGNSWDIYHDTIIKKNTHMITISTDDNNHSSRVTNIMTYHAQLY